MKTNIRKNWLNHVLNGLLNPIFSMFFLIAICIVPGNGVHAASSPVIQVKFQYVIGKTILETDSQSVKIKAALLCPKAAERENFEKAFIEKAEEDFGYLSWLNSMNEDPHLAEWNIVFQIDYELTSNSGVDEAKAVSGILFQVFGKYQTKANPDETVEVHCRIEDPAAPDVHVWVETPMYEGGKGPPFSSGDSSTQRSGEFSIDIIKVIKAQFKQLRSEGILKKELRKVPLSRDIKAYPKPDEAIVVPITLKSLRANADEPTLLRVRLNYTGDPGNPEDQGHPKARIDIEVIGEYPPEMYVKGYLNDAVVNGVDLKTGRSGGWHPKLESVFKYSKTKDVYMLEYQPGQTKNANSGGVFLSPFSESEQ
jgi:hypothetical protein